MKNKVELTKPKEEENQYQGGSVSGKSNYKASKSAEYWAIRVGLIILGFALGIIASNL